MPGELYIGGHGVARGYINLPDLTLTRFLPDPFSSVPGARIYRSGDLARWCPDGTIEYLGRVDRQIKLRGFRIELEEIEAVLRGHPALADATVTVQDHVPGDARLIAHVVPRADAPPADASPTVEVAASEQAQQVSEWRTLYETTYASPFEGSDSSLDTKGWVSSYTGQLIPEEEMRVWRDRAVTRILSLEPRRAWEIGCGTGMLLWKLAPACARYLATDISDMAIASLRASTEQAGLTNVFLEPREASDFRGIEAGCFDTVILNSVVQYFPDQAYLQTVLEGAVRALEPGGVVFVGDVRSLSLLEAFHVSVQLARSPADCPVAVIRERIRRAAETENELSLAPGFFHSLPGRIPGITHAEVWLERGYGSDEMTRYRYDAVLYAGKTPEEVLITASRAWTGDLVAVERWLMVDRPENVELLGIPNARVLADYLAAQKLWDARGTMGELLESVMKDAGAAIHPEVLWDLGDRLGYFVRIRESEDSGPGCMDALFERLPARGRPRAWRSRRNPASYAALANQPLRAMRERRLMAALRSYLAQKLPDYMIPAAFVPLAALPLTPSGKVDRGALPTPEQGAAVITRPFEAPRLELEKELAAIWRDALGVPRVGLDDGFFELGGHSLMLAQVQAAITARLRRDVSIVDLFQYVTIRRLAAHLAGQEDSPHSMRRESPPRTRVRRAASLSAEHPSIASGGPRLPSPKSLP